MDAAALGAAGVVPAAAWAAASAAVGTVPSCALRELCVVDGAICGGGPSLVALVLGSAAASPTLLVLAVLNLAAASQGRDREPQALFAGAVLLHLALGCAAWRLDAWLVGLGLVCLVEPLREHGRTRNGATLALLVAVAALPVAARVTSAHREVSDNGQRARWMAAEPAAFFAESFPGRPVGLLPSGRAIWEGAAVVDLSGLADPKIAAARRRHAYDHEPFDGVLVDRQTWFAAAPQDWQPPRNWTSVAHWTSPAGNVVFYAVRPHAAPELLTALEAWRERLPAAMSLDSPAAIRIPSDAWSTAGDAVEREPDRLAFYTNGNAVTHLPVRGTLVLWVSGSTAKGRAPSFHVDWFDGAGGKRRSFRSTSEMAAYEVAELEAGTKVELVYDDDVQDEFGRDRNLWVWRAEVRP